MNITETTAPQERTFQLIVNEQELSLLQSLFSYISPATAGLDTYRVWSEITPVLGQRRQHPHIVFNTITRKR